MDMLLSPEGSLASLFAAAFIAATLLPFSSEAALFGVLRLHPDLLWPALLVATAGNSAGGMTTYALGRWFNGVRVTFSLKRGRLRMGTKKVTLTPHQLERLRRWGAPATALGWLPLAGDALCLAAGWLQLNAAAVLLWQVLGRFGRYWVVAQTSVM